MPLSDLHDDELDERLRALLPPLPPPGSWKATERERLLRFIAGEQRTDLSRDLSNSPRSARTLALDTVGRRDRPPMTARIVAAAATVIVLLGGLALIQQRLETEGPEAAPDGQLTPPLPALPSKPDRFPVITDRYPRAPEPTAEWITNMPPASDPAGAVAMVARNNGTSISDAIVLSVLSSFDLPAAVEREPMRVAGLDVELIRATEAGPLNTIVVLPGTPTLIAQGLDPIAFLELAGGYPIDGARLDDTGAPTFRIGTLPDDYSTVVEPARLALGTVDARTIGSPYVNNYWRANVWTSVHNPLIDGAPLGTLERIDINGTTGWVRYDETQSAVYWQVSDTTWASIGAGSDPEAGIELARATDFVSESEWVSRYSVLPVGDTRPVPDSQPPPPSPPATTAGTAPASSPPYTLLGLAAPPDGYTLESARYGTGPAGQAIIRYRHHDEPGRHLDIEIFHAPDGDDILEQLGHRSWQVGEHTVFAYAGTEPCAQHVCAIAVQWDERTLVRLAVVEPEEPASTVGLLLALVPLLARDAVNWQPTDGPLTTT